MQNSPKETLSKKKGTMQTSNERTETAINLKLHTISHPETPK